jgi:endonuclease/exonuclease/phosphatase (EEP) superfamily protein YafD
MDCIHARPGRPGRSGAPEDSAPRDAELVLAAREMREAKEPVIVAGDFNDVAWSHTTRLFQRVSRLLDPRVGRAFYNTYNANYWFLRFPVDHLFHSEHFAMVEFKRLPHIGSDHFPIFTVLRLSDEAPQKQEPKPTKPSDVPETQRKVREAEGTGR